MARRNATNQMQDIGEQWAGEGGSPIVGAGFWKPEEKGESLRGVLVSIRPGHGEYEQMVADIRTPNGELHAVGLSQVLEARLTPDLVGTEIGIIYDGNQASQGGGKSYKMFRVFIFNKKKSTDLPF